MISIRFNKYWLILVSIAFLFSILYILSVIFPGNISNEVYKYFSNIDIEKSKEYNKTISLLFISSFLVKLIFLLIFTFGNASKELSNLTAKLSFKMYYLHILLFFIGLWLILKIISFPFSLYYYNFQVKWGFSTQTISSWWIDYLKNSLLDFIISGIGIFLFAYAVNKWHKSWWFMASIFLTFMLFLQNLIWPSFIAPMFNRFIPIKDPVVLNMVQDISKNAGININKVEEMDASRRTKLANAYFYGFGKTSKIVLYDTLLENYPKNEIKAVIAHEAAHWKENHVLKGLVIGSIGLFAMFFLFSLILNKTIINPYNKAITPAGLAVLYLFIILINFDTNPIQNYISRQMERQADLLSVQYLHNKEIVVELQVDLAKKSLSDPEPPAFIEWFSYSHPSAMHRIKAVEACISNIH
ncbi:M48 family metallopeptidase [Aceticella autotrophica]|uniref:M48 family metallopeptidase n=1 Tax=Aceticella autotrophica TaxID=2755338 RepID=A0A975GAX9_9THEO|nr:M48 family metallopeptidase [Aceticella autotrophica]QSZ27954.1 M48 family metallopeptidase [Aceticella autotrophica]